MNDTFLRRAKEIIEQVTYVTIATVDKDGQPWNAPVFAAYDDRYNFYWGSHINAQHSQNIAVSGKAFIVIYDTAVDPGKGEGVYIKAKCNPLVDTEEIKLAYTLLTSRRKVSYWKLDEVQPSSPVRLYKAIPEQVWMNDESQINGHYIDTRVEIKL